MPAAPAGRAVEAEYLRALSDVVTVQEWDEVCRAALRQAKAGNATAREWLSRYLMPTPPAEPAVGLKGLVVADAIARTGRDPVAVELLATMDAVANRRQLAELLARAATNPGPEVLKLPLPAPGAGGRAP
jgi:hypothetical protein